MTGPDLLRRLRQHQRWAFVRLLDATRPLTDDQLRQPFPIGRGSLWDTLVHLYAAEYVWIEAIEGNSNPPRPSDVKLDNLDALHAAWEACDARWTSFLDGLTEFDMSRMVEKTSTSSLPGRPHRTPLADVVMHVALHAQYTTAQAANILRHLGVEDIPDTMLITMSREENASLEDVGNGD